MCGIVGIVSSDGPVDRAVLERMRDTLTHRGPDGAGIEIWPELGVGLGHRRLSIIDLSDAGHQPMSNEDGTVWTVYNGELYNFRALRRQLEARGHSFRSQSDTEVIVHTYEEWGDDCIRRFGGMFAIAIWDVKRRRLVMARDRLGIKPLVYYWDGHTFIFASEIKAILAHPDIDKSVDRSALFDYLTYSYIPSPKTAYSRVHKLPPAHMLVIEGGIPTIGEYWDVNLEERSDIRTSEEAVDALSGELASAVERHMVSDVPVGVFLSGGIDSGTVTALAATSSSERLHSFTIDFDDPTTSEGADALLTAERYGTLHFQRTATRDNVEPMLDKAVALYDEPFGNSSTIPTYQVAALGSEHVKVVLSGDGGDELFAGYQRYQIWMGQQWARWVPRSVARPLLSPIVSLLPHHWALPRKAAKLSMDPAERYWPLVSMFSPAQKRAVLGPEWVREFEGYDDYWFFRRYTRPHLDPTTMAQYLDLKTYLPEDILTKVDRASMAHSLEVRPPLLDHTLVEKVFQVPHTIRWPGGKLKHLMRQISRPWLPPEVLSGSKRGFGVPWSSWMNSGDGWRADFLANGSGKRMGLFADPVGLPEGHLGVDMQSWQLLVLEQWLRRQGADALLPVTARKPPV